MSANIREFLSSLDEAQFNVIHKMLKQPSEFFGKEREAYEEFSLRLAVEKEERDERSFKEEELVEK
jgi:hypothetical protein